MKIDDLFNLYLESTSDNSINKLGFFRIINRIEEEKQIKNLKRLIKRMGNKRTNTYIIVFDKERNLDFNSIRLHNTRSKIKSDKITKKESTSYDSTNNKMQQRNEEVTVETLSTESIPRFLCQPPNPPLPRQNNPNIVNVPQPIMVSLFCIE